MQNDKPAYSTEIQSANTIEMVKGKNLGGPWWKQMFQESRAYLVEYFMILISTGVLLGVVAAMFSNIIAYTDKDRDPGMLDGFAYTASVSMIASLLIVIPLIVVLTKRITGSEFKNAALKDMGWRKGFLGIFLVITSLFALGYAIGYMYELVSYFASFGLGGDAKSFPWRGLLENGVIASLFTFTAWLYSYDYRQQPNVRAGMIRLHHYGLIVLAVFFTIIYLATAFQQQRGAFIDEAISGDLRNIRNKIDAYESDNNKLPSSLDDLELNKQQESRAEKFNYEYTSERRGNTYTLCAEFKTDTRNKGSGSQNPLTAFSGSSYDEYSRSSSKDDPTIHDKGRACFEYEAYGSSSYYDSYYDDTRSRGLDYDQEEDDAQIFQD